MYTLESLKPLNPIFDREHGLEADDVETVNCLIKLIEGTRSENPCLGDIIEHTNEYGEYSQNAHIEEFDDVKGQILINVHPYVPFVYSEDNEQEVGFFKTSGGPEAFVDAALLTYIGKREKMFAAFSNHCILPAHSSVYFKATVNVWEYVAPDQKHPGYSTKDWEKQYISYRRNPVDGCIYHYYGQNIAFKDTAELQRWKETYKAVEFPSEPDHSVLFLYRETDKLVSRKEWDALNLPLDTRLVNGVIHVKVDYDDDAHVITVYRFTNSGYLNPKRFCEYEKAKGTTLVPPGPEIKEEKTYINWKG